MTPSDSQQAQTHPAEYAHPRLHARTSPEKIAFVLADTGQSLTYRELVNRSEQAAQAFNRLGLRGGDTIAILLENHIRYPELCWAAKNSGIAYVCISRHLNVEDATYIVRDSGAKILVSSAALSAVALGVAEKVKGIHCLMLDGAVAPFLSYEELIAAEAPEPLPGRCRGPSMLYSSGTTGRPKGVRVPWPQVPPEVPPPRSALLIRNYSFSPETTLLLAGPLYHAIQRFMYSMQRAGGTVIAFAKFDPAATLRTIQDYSVTHGLFVPTMLSRMLALPDEVRERFDLSSLRFAVHTAAPCPVGVKEALINWWGPIVYEMYGGTESIGHTFISSEEWLTHKGSVGRPAQGCRIRIVDEEQRELPPFAPGVIYMNNGHRFEYNNDPEKTAGAYLDDDGQWATMGDIGYLDHDGYLYITDRQSFMIISGGVNIYPQEAENVLLTHPAVADAAVIGIPHTDYGEEVKAVVEVKESSFDAAALEAELLAYCRERLSAIKCPRSVDFAASLPRSEAGKLMKRELRQRYWQGHDSLIV
ncbi:MAG: AMP-binding protein [Georgfuchsia sp.]